MKFSFYKKIKNGYSSSITRVSIPVVTIIAGAVATIAGLFPAFAMKLLGFVALYGFILTPIGAIIVFDVYFFPRFGVQQNYAEKSGS